MDAATAAHEARINEALRALGDEYRLGMVAPEEFRQRRRALLATWGERDVTTSPGSLRTAELPTSQIPVTRPGPAQVRAPAAKGGNGLLVVAVVLGLAAAGFAAWKFMRPARPAAPAQATPAAAQLPPQVAGFASAADRFLARNDWESSSIEPLLAVWRTLPAELRARARTEPSFRTLRHALDQNIQAEAQLVAPDAAPEQRQRLDLLTRFAQELDA